MINQSTPVKVSTPVCLSCASEIADLNPRLSADLQVHMGTRPCKQGSGLKKGNERKMMLIIILHLYLSCCYLL